MAETWAGKAKALWDELRLPVPVAAWDPDGPVRRIAAFAREVEEARDAAWRETFAAHGQPGVERPSQIWSALAAVAREAEAAGRADHDALAEAAARWGVRNAKLILLLAHVTGKASDSTMHYWPTVCSTCAEIAAAIEAAGQETT
jgi:hypothetical protein